MHSNDKMMIKRREKKNDVDCLANNHKEVAHKRTLNKHLIPQVLLNLALVTVKLPS